MTRFNAFAAAIRSPRALAAGLLAMGLIGCDVQEDDDWASGEDPPMGGAEEAEGEESPEAGTAYTYVIIEDVSPGYNDNGTPGVDICGVSFVCDDGTEGWATAVSLDTGAGFICSGDDEECLADRGDAEAALGEPEAFCEPASVPSDYVSLGVGGRIALKLEVPDQPDALEARGGIGGCTLIIHELDGMTDEAYTVNLCTSASGEDCQSEDGIMAAMEGGSISVFVTPTEGEMVAQSE